MTENVSLSQLLEVLTELVDDKMSGTLFIRSESNRAISFGIQKGVIHAILFGPKRGRKAIPLISQITGGSYKFQDMEMSGINHELPTTPEILNLLRTPQKTEAAPRQGTSNVNQLAVSEEERDAMCQQLKGILAEYLGPIADMVFDEALDETGDICTSYANAQALVDKLSLDMDDESEIEQFKDSAYTAINKFLKK